MTRRKPEPPAANARRQSRRTAGLNAAAKRDGYFKPGSPSKPSASAAMTAWAKGEARLVQVTAADLAAAALRDGFATWSAAMTAWKNGTARLVNASDWPGTVAAAAAIEAARKDAMK